MFLSFVEGGLLGILGAIVVALSVAGKFVRRESADLLVFLLSLFVCGLAVAQRKNRYIEIVEKGRVIKFDGLVFGLSIAFSTALTWWLIKIYRPLW